MPRWKPRIENGRYVVELRGIGRGTADDWQEYERLDSEAAAWVRIIARRDRRSPFTADITVSIDPAGYAEVCAGAERKKDIVAVLRRAICEQGSDHREQSHMRGEIQYGMPEHDGTACGKFAIIAEWTIADAYVLMNATESGSARTMGVGIYRVGPVGRTTVRAIVALPARIFGEAIAAYMHAAGARPLADCVRCAIDETWSIGPAAPKSGIRELDDEIPF